MKQISYKNWVVLSFLGLFLISFPLRGDAEESGKVKFKKIHGGSSYDSAVPMEFNRDYRLDHHQKTGEFDYFSVHLEPDTVLTLEIQTLEKGISWNNGRRVVTTEPHAGLQLQDEKKTVLRSVEIAGKPRAFQKESFRNRGTKGADFYILVGSPRGSLHRDHVNFKVTVSPFIYGDLGTDQDAGSSGRSAMLIQPATYYGINSLGGGDSKDVFAFEASKKEWYALAVTGEDPISGGFRVKVKNLKNKEIVSYISGGTEKIVTKSFEIPKNGEYTIEIGLNGPVSQKSLYSMELSKVAGPFRGR